MTETPRERERKKEVATSDTPPIIVDHMSHPRVTHYETSFLMVEGGRTHRLILATLSTI
jgi:hypothetical protein